MKRALGPILAALFLACSGDRPLTPNGAPVFAISDGNHSLGNPDFFFLPPLVPSPSGNVHYQPAQFNPDLVPVVDVCELSGDPGTGAVTCVGTAFGPVNAALSGGKYSVSWNTKLSNGGAGLNVLKFYRIRVFGSSNGTLLGFADVDPVSTGSQLKNIQTNEVIGLVDGRTLPINFSVEEGALCQPAGTAFCTTETVVLATGGTVVLEETGDRVIVPPQPDRPGQVVALTLQPCDDDLPIDNPKVGPCLHVTADPPLVGPLTVRARVLLCSLDREDDLGGLTHEQSHLLKVHRLDAGPPLVVQALPEASAAECFGGLGMEPQGVLERLGQLAFKLLAPKEARASSVVLDVGEGGSTDFFSLFQLALPVKMEASTSTELTGSPDEPVEPAPQVVVRDYNDDVVPGVKVHFAITSENGGTVTPVEVLTNADGRATVSSWVLGDEGSHTLRAYGWGIADPSNNGPQEGFDPFMPDITQPLADQDPAFVGTGEILFHATASEGTGGNFTVQTIASNLEFPDGLWINGGYAYFTETNGRNTVFGGAVRLRRFNLATGGLETLINNPINADAIVVNTLGTPMLAGYAGTTPGEDGNVSTVNFDVEFGWFEAHLTDLAIAAHDMFVDPEGQVFVIGSSDDPEASSLYRLGAENIVVASGLGRAQAVTKVGATTFYARLAPPEIRSINSDGFDELVVETGATGLTSDGTWLYYAEFFNGRISRKHLTTGATETVLDGLFAPQNVRWSAGKLYFVEGGTPGASYKDGTLKVATENVVVP